MQLRGWEAEEKAKEKLENDEEYDKGGSKERMASATRPRPQHEPEQEEEQRLTRKYRFNHYLY